MLDDCSKTRCHNGQPCLAHLQCSTSFVLSPKYYPAMNYSGGTKLFQTWNLEGVWSKLFNGNETDIFHTHHTYTFHGLLPIEQRQLRICKYSWWYDIGENSFFFNWKAWKQDWFCQKKVKLAKGRGCVTTKLERLREWNDFSTSCKSWKGFFTLPSENVWNKG